MKKDLLSAVKIVLPLVLICLLVVSMIAAVNHFTAPIIEENSKRRLNTEIKDLFALTAENQAVVKARDLDQTDIDQTLVKALYEVYINDELVGLCADVMGEGAYKGKIEVLVALDPDGRIIDLSCIAQSETPGKGDAVLNDDFYQSHYAGKTQEQLSKEAAVISGSTKTSTALKNAVNHAFNAYNALYGEEG